MRESLRKRFSRQIRGRIKSLPLSRHGIGVLSQTRNGLLVVDPRDYGVARALLSSGAYAWEEISWLTRLLCRDSRLVFVGAHIGSLLVPLALGSGARDVEAFEPSPANQRLLKANLALNGLAESTVLHPIAVGDCSGSVQFTENLTNTGNSRIAHGGGGLQVEVRTLDGALSADRPIDLLVVDTEGFEAHALRGAARTLEKTRYLYLEYAPEQLAEQGGKPADLLDLVSARFSSMYLPGKEVRFFPSLSYLPYLRELPARRGLLLNLLFSNDAQPASALMEPTPAT